MTTPYTLTQSVEATGGVSNCITLNVPSRAIITRLVVKQLDGDLDGFAFDLYDRADCCSGTVEDSANPDDGIQLIDSELHQLQATQTVAGGSATSKQLDLSIPYVNQDERDVSNMANRKLYMDLTPGGSGEKSFGIAITVTVDAP